MKKMIIKFLLFLLKKLDIPNVLIDMDFYVEKNGKWEFLKSGELDRVPSKGDNVELFIVRDNPEVEFDVVKVVFRIGKNAKVFLKQHS